MIAVAPAWNGADFKSVTELLVEEVSASRLKRWSTSRLQFYFHYVQHIKKPATPALVVGKVVHSVLQDWNKYRWRSEEGFRENLNEIFDAKWIEEQIDQEIEWDGDEPKQKTAALGLLKLYLDQTPIPRTERPLAVEVHLEADLGKHGLPRLIGFIDLVRPGGKIVDFKTSAQTPNADAVAHQNEIQLTVYGLLYRDATDRIEAGFELHHLVKTKTPKLIVTSLPPSTDKQQTRLFKQIDSYVEGVKREDCVPSVGMAYLSCQFQTECRAWN